MKIKRDYLYNDLMQQLNVSRYIPTWVQAYMRKTTLLQTTITSKIQHPLTFRLYHETTDSYLVKMIRQQLKSLNTYFTKNIGDLGTRKINIVLILSKKAKFIDKRKSKVIDTENINSGVCIHHNDPEAVHIIIYRVEDLMKVLFHEIIHYIGADLRFYDDDKIKNIEMMIQTHIPSLSNVEIYFNEAFTEALARYHYSQYSYKHSVGSDPKTQLKKQQDYSIEVVKLFLALYDCKNLKEFSKLKSYTEKSHAFSYIVIASALLNSQDFISDVIMKGNLNNLENIVYKALLQNNEWYKAVTNKSFKKNKMKFYFKLSI